MDSSISVTNLDAPDKPAFLSGRELSDVGLPVQIADHPGAAVFTYHRKADWTLDHQRQKRRRGWHARAALLGSETA